MTEQEFYIRLLNYDSKWPSEFDPEFLKNYEIAKLVLDKFSIHRLNENQQRNLNLEAVSAWFRVSKYICLDCDIPEILELLPERIIGDLNLESSEIQILPELKSVEGNLFLQNSQIQSLPKLESVGGELDLRDSKIQSLPQLESVRGHLELENSQIQSLPKLESVEWSLGLRNSKIKFLPKLEAVGGSIYTKETKLYYINYFNETGRQHLAEKVSW